MWSEVCRFDTKIFFKWVSRCVKIGYKNGGSVLFFGDEQLIRKSYVDFILILKK